MKDNLKKNGLTKHKNGVTRNKQGQIIKGSRANNPKGRCKGNFNKRTWVEATLKDRLPELLGQAMIQVNEGNDKVLNFLLSRILPVKPILERENATKLTSNAQENLLNILQDHSEDRVSTEEANNRMLMVQKQIEIQQSDFVALQNKVEEQNKRMEEILEKMR